jgi:hypothetical protein
MPMGDDETSPSEIAREDEQEALRELDEATDLFAETTRLREGADALATAGYGQAGLIVRTAAAFRQMDATEDMLQAIDLGTAAGGWDEVQDDLNQRMKAEALAEAAAARADKADARVGNDELNDSQREAAEAEFAAERAREKAALHRAQKMGEAAKASEESARMHERTARKRGG